MNVHIQRGNEELKKNNFDAAIEAFLLARDDNDPIVHRIAVNRLSELVPPFVYGSSSSNLYHREDCPAKKAIFRYHLVRFHDWRQAEEAGYKQCPLCSPPKIGVIVPK